MGLRAVADTCCRITSGIARMRLNRNDGDAFAAHKSRRPSLPDCSDRLSLLLPKRLLPAFAFRFFFDACRLSRWPLAGCKTGRPLVGTSSDTRRGIHHGHQPRPRSEEHTSELQSLMRISYAVFCL